DFEKLIDEDSNILNLRDLVKMMDSIESFNKWLENKPEIPYILLCYGEAFYSIREHFIENLPSVINYLFIDGYIDSCLMQNPPSAFIQSMKRVFKGNLEENEYKHKNISKQSLIKIAEKYKDEIVGQDEALVEILSTLYPLVNRLDEKPIVMMFYGPAGVGKTEAAKIINDSLDQGGILRQQMSMFQTSDFASYLFGGTLEAPSLAKDLMKREGNVILFDEFNRCSPYLYSAFFQMFDEGIYIDKNYEVGLKNSIIICTANFGSMEEIFGTLGAPLFSRFDHFIAFNDLSTEAKKTLIENKYNEILESWDANDIEVIKENVKLEELVDQADFFTNARNIEKGIKGKMARTVILD
ncbi:TPA_asm: AAA domain-containing protein, partial [Listeria monocytogenes]|nr:AAA domain-containing protein [Listeria monocytogenes]